MPANAAALDEFIVRDWAFGRVPRNQPGSRSFAESKHVSTFCLIQCLARLPRTSSRRAFIIPCMRAAVPRVQLPSVFTVESVPRRALVVAALVRETRVQQRPVIFL